MYCIILSSEFQKIKECSGGGRKKGFLDSQKFFKSLYKHMNSQEYICNSAFLVIKNFSIIMIIFAQQILFTIDFLIGIKVTGYDNLSKSCKAYNVPWVLLPSVGHEPRDNGHWRGRFFIFLILEKGISGYMCFPINHAVSFLIAH